jgi:protease PrsW
MATSGRLNRYAWILVLLGGMILNVLVLLTLIATENPNFVPSLILLGSAIVPATFLTFSAGHIGRWSVSGGMLGLVALLSGVLGTIFAGWLEYDELSHAPWLGIAGIGFIEEVAKLIMPAAILIFAARRYPGPANGLMIGMASGLGFAVLETMGYAFVTLIKSGGSIGAVEEILLVRGLLSPPGHTSWAGLSCAALWTLMEAPGTRTALAFVGTFLAVVALHAAWDGSNSILGYVVIGVVSVGWLLWRIRRIRLLEEPPAPHAAPMTRLRLRHLDSR